MLKVRSLHKSFGTKTILTDFNLTVPPHEIVFLSGPSGSGKSTALRAIANLDTYKSGNVSLNGETMDTIGSAQWRRDVMYVSQSRIQHNCTPVELLIRVLKFSSRGSLYKEVDRLVEEYVVLCNEVGLDRELLEGQKWMELSGGQAQRAAVVMCIALKPKVLLLDEPSSSCDHQSALLLEKVIVKSGIAAVWVSHDGGQRGRVGGKQVQISEDVV